MEVYARALCALKVCNPTLCSIKKKRNLISRPRSRTAKKISKCRLKKTKITTFMKNTLRDQINSLYAKTELLDWTYL